MLIRKHVLERILIEASRFVARAESLHLSSIAKSIEHERGCQIFIEPFDEREPTGQVTGCLATCEPCIVREVGRPPLKEFKILKIQHHFIFYRPFPENIEVERFRIAHELGHCALHWPLGPRADRLFKGSYHGINDMYMVGYIREEEEEADAFACLLTAHRPAPTTVDRAAPPRSTTLELNESIYRKIEEYERLGLPRWMQRT
ncbi:MAG: hypothetical protein ACYTEL_14910 [Planctomycetota bacterium]|jgi:hypothetical protein